jgi:hypothetical protein
VLAARDGSVASAIRRFGHDELEFPPGPGEGALLDVLRRVLRLPTPPPDVGLGELFAKLWLEEIVSAGRRSRHSPKLSWERAAALHAALRVRDRPSTANNLVALGSELATATSWERLRQAWARGSGAGARDAAWMDAGMFARCMVEGRPPVEDLLRRATHRLTPAAAKKVREALAAWGLLPALAA